MNALFRFLILPFLFAISLIGCGGGGGDVLVPVAPQISTTTSVATFSNVATNPLITTVMPGQRDVEVAAFRTAWKDGSHYPISQLGFENKYDVPMGQMFKKFQLVDNNGVDIANEAIYFVQVDDVKHQVIIDFYSTPWYAFDSQTLVPRTYSLLASMDSLAKDGQQFKLSLTTVHMHNAGQSILSEVTGRDFKVVTTPGMELPVITYSTPASMNFDNSVAGTFADIGSFSVKCPATNQYVCVFTEVDFNSFGSSAPYLSVDGAILSASMEAKVNSNFRYTFYYVIYPGETKTFTFNGMLFGVPPTPSGVPIQSFQTVSTYVNDVVLYLGPNKVSPVLPSGQDSCSLIVADHRFCKG